MSNIGERASQNKPIKDPAYLCRNSPTVVFQSTSRYRNRG